MVWSGDGEGDGTGESEGFDCVNCGEGLLWLSCFDTLLCGVVKVSSVSPVVLDGVAGVVVVAIGLDMGIGDVECSGWTVIPGTGTFVGGYVFLAGSTFDEGALGDMA